MEYKFKAWVKPVIENGEIIYTGWNSELYKENEELKKKLKKYEK